MNRVLAATITLLAVLVGLTMAAAGQARHELAGGDPGLVMSFDFENCPTPQVIDQRSDDPCNAGDGLRNYSFFDSNGEYTAIVASADCHGRGPSSGMGKCIRFALRDGNPGISGVINMAAYEELGITDLTTMYFSGWVRYKKTATGPGWREPGPPGRGTRSRTAPSWHKIFYINSAERGFPIFVLGCGGDCGTAPVSVGGEWAYGQAGGRGTKTVPWTRINDDMWHRFEVYAENGSRGLIRTCVDGVKVEDSSIDWKNNGVWKEVLLSENLAWMDNDADPTSDSKAPGDVVYFFMDDVYWSRSVPESGACSGLQGASAPRRSN